MSLLSIRDVFLAEARDYKTIRETGGPNRGPAVEFFQKLGTIGPGAPWCAAYINAIAEIACSKKDIKSPFENVPLQGYVQAYYQYAKDHGWLTITPQAGDLFMIYFPTKDRYAHIGIVTGIGEDGFATIEGNSNEVGSRDGIGVFENVRKFSERIAFANPWG